MADPIQEVPGAIDPFISQLENPDPVHDINPASAATAATEATEVSAASKEDLIESAPASDANSIDSDVVHPHRVIKQAHQRQRFPPLPDLRFEHNFNASLEGADTWGKVTWIIVRDQIIFPFLQGTIWTLALIGWRHWNRSASLSGQTLGSRIRRWWYGVNNWRLPPISTSQQHAAQHFLHTYQAQFSDAGPD